LEADLVLFHEVKERPRKEKLSKMEKELRDMSRDTSWKDQGIDQGERIP